ncbi:60S ribosomal protein L36 [Platanthera guangdongensis]|uniref:60S ribosomal protein L36 n=1 Tax=Platanthera guangdongensis TaxID=2320717 RepID=A0ABR2LN19_9ASPA
MLGRAQGSGVRDHARKRRVQDCARKRRKGACKEAACAGASKEAACAGARNEAVCARTRKKAARPKLILFIWLNKGRPVTRKELPPRPSSRKGVESNLYICLIIQKTSKRVRFVKNLIREVAGFVPYEKRITELLKVGIE